MRAPEDSLFRLASKRAGQVSSSDSIPHPKVVDLPNASRIEVGLEAGITLDEQKEEQKGNDRKQHLLPQCQFY